MVFHVSFSCMVIVLSTGCQLAWSVCDIDAMTMCKQNIYGNLNSDSRYILKNRDNLCSGLTEFENCIRNLKDDCSGERSFEIGFGVFIKKMNYMCGDGRNEISKYIECLTGKDVQNAEVECSTKATKKFEDEILFRTGQCQYYEYISNCTYTEYSCSCGASAGKLMKRMDNISYADVMSLQNCLPTENVEPKCNGGRRGCCDDVKFLLSALLCVLIVFFIN